MILYYEIFFSTIQNLYSYALLVLTMKNHDSIKSQLNINKLKSDNVKTY